jgi:hypothetical protein
MTTTKRAKRPRISSPLAPLTGYTNIKEPDTKFDPNGTFKARILLDPDNEPLRRPHRGHQERDRQEEGQADRRL